MKSRRYSGEHTRKSLVRLAFTERPSEARQLSANRCLHSLGFSCAVSNVEKALLRGNWIVVTCELMKSCESTAGLQSSSVGRFKRLQLAITMKTAESGLSTCLPSANLQLVRLCWVTQHSDFSCYPCLGRRTPRLCKLILLIFRRAAGFYSRISPSYARWVIKALAGEEFGGEEFGEISPHRLESASKLRAANSIRTSSLPIFIVRNCFVTHFVQVRWLRTWRE